jgi:hypothetical protein
LHPDRLVLIRYHWYHPDNTDPYYRYNITENMARNNYYGNDYSPHLFLDGNIDAGANTGSWGSMINSELAVSAPLDIEIGGEYDDIARSGQVNVRLVATAPISYSTLKVRIAIIESNIYRVSPNGTSWHHQTFRDMTPNTTGIALTIAEGDTVNLTQGFNCPSTLNQSNCAIVVFVQSDSGHRILQGARRSLMSMSYLLTPFSLIAPANYDTVPTCTTTFVWHRSEDSDSGYAVNYQAIVDYTPTFSHPFLVSDTLGDTTWSPALCFPDDSTYYWKVIAFNGHTPERTCEAIFRFTVNEEPPLDPFSLIAPPDRDTVATCTTTFVWNSSHDPDPGYEMHYLGYVNFTPSFENAFLISDTLSDTTWSPPLCFPNDSTYYWMVVAFDGHGFDTTCDSVFTFTINEPPPLCDYVAGDANGNGTLNGLDVTFSVAYFKGGPPPPYECECTPGNSWYVSGDVNASCSFNGLDVTYMVAYFKGGPGPNPCPNCPSRR